MTIGGVIGLLAIVAFVVTMLGLMRSAGRYDAATGGPDDDGHGCPLCQRDPLRIWQTDRDGGRWMHALDSGELIRCREQDPIPEYCASVVPLPVRERRRA